MQGFQEIEQKLTRAVGLGDELAAGWEAFQLIVMVADRYSLDPSQWSTAWMFAIPPACHGRDCLGQAPSMRRDPAPEVSLLDLAGVGDEEAAAGLAALAGTLHERLLEIAATATVPADARACAEAAEMAAALREQLAVDGLWPSRSASSWPSRSSGSARPRRTGCRACTCARRSWFRPGA